MTSMADETSPVRGSMHDALAAFLGEWRAEGTSYGGTDQTGPDPRANGVPWISTHTAIWHTGAFFLIQDERAKIDGALFDTLSILGLEPDGNGYFARTFENHGFYRHYQLSVEDRTWHLAGDTERATTIFSADGTVQTIHWEWLRDGRWLPLCDRVVNRLT